MPIRALAILPAALNALSRKPRKPKGLQNPRCKPQAVLSRGPHESLDHPGQLPGGPQPDRDGQGLLGGMALGNQLEPGALKFSVFPV